MRKPPAIESIKRLYDVRQAGTFLAVSHWTVRALVNAGKIPYCKIGKKILIDVGDLHNFVDRLKDEMK